MKKILGASGIGLTILNAFWSATGLFILFRDLNNDIDWRIILLLLFLNLVLAFSLGQIIEHFETLYLKGKLLSSGKYTADK